MKMNVIVPAIAVAVAIVVVGGVVGVVGCVVAVHGVDALHAPVFGHQIQ